MLKFGRQDLHDLPAYKIQFPYKHERTDGITKLDANESSSAARIEDGVFIDLDINRYPDPEASELCELIAKQSGVRPETIVVGNGSDELINNLMVCFFGQRIIIPNITYPVYSHFATIYKLSLRTFPLANDTFDFPEDVGSYYKHFGPDLSFISYPNNPTGNCFDRNKIEMLIRENPGTLFVIDEAYLEYSQKTLVSLVDEFRNVAVLRTLSKAWGLAGLRLGYIIANVNVADLLKKVRLPYNLNSIAQKVACEVLKNQRDQMLSGVKATVEERDFLSNEFAAMNGFSVFPSDANFLFAKLEVGLDIAKLREELMSKGIFLRFFSYPPDLNFVRFSVGKRAENVRAMHALRKACLASQLKRNGT